MTEEYIDKKKIYNYHKYVVNFNDTYISNYYYYAQGCYYQHRRNNNYKNRNLNYIIILIMHLF